MAVRMNLDQSIPDLHVAFCILLEAYCGVAWLFLGVANSDALLYDQDWKKIAKQYPSNFR